MLLGAFTSPSVPQNQWDTFPKLALGTGDLDCVYHGALRKLRGVDETGNEDQKDMLDTLVDGRRLRDISDLPFDLAI